MQFISTRGGMSPIGFTDVLLQGLAPDGGLTIPAETPRLTAEDLESLRPLPYAELAARIIGLASPGDAHADLLYAKDPANGETVDGALTKGEARAFEPLGNGMSYAVLTGARLKAVLAQQWRPGDGRGVLPLGTSSNLSVRIDQDAADELYAIHDEVAKGATTADAKATSIADARSRVIASIVIDGVPLADDDSVLVASSSPLMAGGDGYAALSEVSAVATDSVDREVLTEYLEYLASFGGGGASASYLKHQTGLASTISQANPRAATLSLTGLVHSNDSEKPRGVTSVRYSYQEASGVTVTSGAVAVDTTTVANRPETGRATLQVVFGQDAAAQKCSFGDAQDTSCFLATIELLDVSGAVLSTYGYELAIDGSAAMGIDSEAGAGGAGASMHAEEVVVAPTPVGRSDRGFSMARTGATIGIGVIALGLLIGGAILLVRRRGGADEGDAVDAEDGRELLAPIRQIGDEIKVILGEHDGDGVHLMCAFRTVLTAVNNAYGMLCRHVLRKFPDRGESSFFPWRSGT